MREEEDRVRDANGKHPQRKGFRRLFTDNLARITRNLYGCPWISNNVLPATAEYTWALMLIMCVRLIQLTVCVRACVRVCGRA